jgi:hypothetical protein
MPLLTELVAFFCAVGYKYAAPTELTLERVDERVKGPHRDTKTEGFLQEETKVTKGKT